MHLSELKTLHISQLLDMAMELEIDNAQRMRKQELMFAILKKRAKAGEQIFGDGTLEVLPDKGGELGTAQGTGVLADDFAVLVNEDGRDAADAVFGGNLVAFINVVLGNDNLTGVGVGSFLKKRAEHTAGGAPRSPEVNKHGLVGNLLDFGVEVGVVYDTDVFAHF